MGEKAKTVSGIKWKIYAQSQRSIFNASQKYSERLEEYLSKFDELMAYIQQGEWVYVPGALSYLGASVSILFMVSRVNEARKTMADGYDGLKKKVRLALDRVNKKEEFPFDVVDDMEEFKRYLMCQAQSYNLGITLAKDISKRQEMKELK